MRIPSQSFPASLTTRLQQLTAQETRFQNQVSTGLRINKASDDPAAVGRVLNLQAENQQLKQFSNNSSRALDISTASYAAVDGLKDVSTRAGELAVLGTGTTSPDAYKAYTAETDQLLEQAMQAANSQFGGNYLLGGTATDAAPFTATRDANGKITGVAYTGTADAASFRVSEGRNLSPYTNGATNQKMADFMNNLVKLRDGLKAADSSAVQSSRTGLNTSEDDILVTISDIGATQNRIQADDVQNSARAAELEKLTSKDTSADVATAVIQLNQAQTQYQAALQSGAKIMQMSLLDYIR